MRKRLVRKAFDMILGISMSENREVCCWIVDFLFVVTILVFDKDNDILMILSAPQNEIMA